jgi:hypothetical protein
MLQYWNNLGMSLLCLPPHNFTGWSQQTSYLKLWRSTFMKMPQCLWEAFHLLSQQCKSRMKAVTAGNAANGFHYPALGVLNTADIPDSAYITRVRLPKCEALRNMPHCEISSLTIKTHSTGEHWVRHLHYKPLPILSHFVFFFTCNLKEWSPTTKIKTICNWGWNKAAEEEPTSNKYIVERRNKKFWEELIAYFPLKRHGPHRMRRPKQFFNCWVYSLQW